MNSIFQQQDFYRFLEATEFLEPFRFSVQRVGREVGTIQGFIQKDGSRVKQFFSRRAIINGGPWLAEDIRETELENLLRQCIDGLKRRAIYIETRNYSDYSQFRPTFERLGFVYEPHYDYQVKLSDGNAWEGRMESSRRRFVKSSLQQGAMIVANPTMKDVKGFYTILQDLYRKRIKKPLFPLSFFNQMLDTSFCKYILVEYQQEIIGGMLCVFDDDSVYEWFVCGKDGCYPKIYPSTLATWAAIRFAAEHGFKRFDMMGAGAPGDGGYGVREFKAKFGGELVEYGRFVYVCSRPLYNIGKAAVSIMKKL